MLVTILSVVGALVVVLLVMYIVMRYVKHDSHSGGKMWPPRDYMQFAGQRCPDYWKYMGDVDGKHRCKNVFNIPVAKPDGTCYNGSTAMEADFDIIRSFPKKPGNAMDRVLKSRCNWVRKCGPPRIKPDGTATTTPVGMASWTGIDKYC